MRLSASSCFRAFVPSFNRLRDLYVALKIISCLAPAVAKLFPTSGKLFTSRGWIREIVNKRNRKEFAVFEEFFREINFNKNRHQFRQNCKIFPTVHFGQLDDFNVAKLFKIPRTTGNYVSTLRSIQLRKYILASFQTQPSFKRNPF